MKQFESPNFKNLDSENCISQVKASLARIEKLWASGKVDDLIAEANKLKKDTEAFKRTRNLELSEITKSLSEYAFFLFRMDDENQNSDGFHYTQDYLEKELLLLSLVREATYSYIKTQLSETNGISRQEAEVLFVLSDRYNLSFDEDF